MTTNTDELSSLITHLSPEEQKRVLRFTRVLAHPPAFPHTLLPPGHVVAQLRVSPEADEAIEQALEDTVRVWPDE